MKGKTNMNILEIVHVHKVSYDEYTDIIDDYENEENLKRMVCHDHEWNEHSFISCDNTTGEAFTEEFISERTAVLHSAGCLNDSFGLRFEVNQGDSCELKTIIYNGETFNFYN